MGSRSFDDLVALIARLRDPARGCPWDRMQDHKSLRPYLLEEAYEAIAAIDAGDADALAFELGDVLLQVLLHSRIAEERGEFAVGDVIEHLAEKLTRRHPHVFENAPSDLPSVHRRWHDIKRREHRVEARLPILVRARKALAADGLLEAAARRAEETSSSAEERAGAQLLAAVAAAWRDGLDPELVLEKALDRVCREARG